MTHRDSIMFALYLIVIAMGAVMMGERHDALGLAQMITGAVLFALRLQRCVGKR